MTPLDGIMDGYEALIAIADNIERIATECHALASVLNQVNERPVPNESKARWLDCHLASYGAVLSTALRAQLDSAHPCLPMGLIQAHECPGA